MLNLILKNATAREFLYNEILPSVIEKQKILDANERPVYQLLDQYQKTERGAPKAYCCKKESHATLFPKKFVPFYSEDLKFLITCCAWRVTKTYSHFTFEQSTFKLGFILNN